jgi:hypothetical protein
MGNRQSLSSGFLQKALSNEEQSSPVHQDYLFLTALAISCAKARCLLLVEKFQTFFRSKYGLFSQFSQQLPTADHYHSRTSINVSSYTGQVEHQPQVCPLNICSTGCKPTNLIPLFYRARKG